MAFYYVKVGGTATGDAGRAASARTGSFATMGVSAYYDAIRDVLTAGVPTTAFATGDTCCVSDGHDKDTSVSSDWLLKGNCRLLCVDDANAENISHGAVEGALTGGNHVEITGEAGNIDCTYGIGIRGRSAPGPGFGPDACLLHERGKAEGLAGNTLTLTNGSGHVGIYRDCSFKLNATSGGLIISARTTCEIMGRHPDAALIDASGTKPTSVFKAIGANVVGRCLDLSHATGVVGATANEDSPVVDLSRIKIGSGATLSEADDEAGPVVNAVGVGEITAGPDDYWGFQNRYYNFGATDHDTSIYREGGADVDGSQKLTALMQAESGVIPYFAPLRFKLAELTLDLSSSVILTVELAQWDDGSGAPTRLKVDEFWLEVERPDATDLALGVIDTTRPSTYDISATQSDLAASTKVWKKGSDDSTISADITKSAVPITMPTIAAATTAHVTVWACLAKDLSAVGDVNVDLEVAES